MSDTPEPRDDIREHPGDETSSAASGPRPRPEPQEGPKPAPGPRPRPRPEADQEDDRKDPLATRRIPSPPLREPEETPTQVTAPPEGSERAGELLDWDEARRAAEEIRRRRGEEGFEPGPRPRPGGAQPQATQERSRPATDASEERDRFRQVMTEVASYAEDGYDVMGMIGYPAAGKTHTIKALTHLLSNFDVDVRERLGSQLSPEKNPADVDILAYHGTDDSPEDRTIFLDAGGELYARLRKNEWDLLPESQALLHALGRAKGLFFVTALHSGHFRSGGEWVGMTAEERRLVQEAQKAHEEQGLVDLSLLFLRALQEHGGEVEPVVKLCSEATTVSEGLREYRVNSARLEVPVVVLFTKADQWVEKELVLGAGDYLAPHRRPIGVAPFVRTHLEFLYSTVSSHARRFHFDFAQSYFQSRRGSVDSLSQEQEMKPEWERDGEPMSVGLLPALEFLLRNKPRRDLLGRLLQRLEIDTATAHRIHRTLHPTLWRGTAR